MPLFWIRPSNLDTWPGIGVQVWDIDVYHSCGCSLLHTHSSSSNFNHRNIFRVLEVVFGTCSCTAGIPVIDPQDYWYLRTLGRGGLLDVVNDDVYGQIGMCCGQLVAYFGYKMMHVTWPVQMVQVV